MDFFLRRFATLLRVTENTLLGVVTSFYKTVLFLGGVVLFLGYNASMLVHVQVALRKSSSRLVSGAMPDLSSRAQKHVILVSIDMVLAIICSVVSFSHFIKLGEKKNG
jgi:hypothetical protein